jgi:hypothetical protein
MNLLLKKLSCITFCALIVGCSHPLDIEGKGDISSSTGQRDCNDGDEPCKNMVVNAYSETYTAEPKAGWKFLEWSGCFSDKVSIECSFKADANAVKKNWGKTMPPLKAKFIRVRLNDTGITFGGGYPEGVNSACVGPTIAQQDCATGRDSSDNNNVNGHAAFSFSKLNENGFLLNLSVQNWSCTRYNISGFVW